MSRDCQPIPCPPYRGMPAGRILVDEGLSVREPAPEATVAAAAAVRAAYAARTGGRACTCGPDPILDRTPEALLRDALAAAPTDPADVDVRATIEHVREVWRSENARQFTEWLMRLGF